MSSRHTWLAAICCLLAAGCVKTVKIDPPTDDFWPAEEHGNPSRANEEGKIQRNLTLTFTEFSEEDFAALRPDMNKDRASIKKDGPIKYGWLVERLRASPLDGSKALSIYTGGKGYHLLYCTDSKCQDRFRGGVRLHFLYDAEARTAFVSVDAYSPGDFALLQNLDRWLLSAIQQGGEYDLVATRLAWHLRAPGRAIEAQTSGMIAIESLVDPGTPLNLGNHSFIADERGRFRFEGRPSMRRVSEGVILLVAPDGTEVEVRRTETGRWVVLLQGIRKGSSFEQELPVEGLSDQ